MHIHIFYQQQKPKFSWMCKIIEKHESVASETKRRIFKLLNLDLSQMQTCWGKHGAYNTAIDSEKSSRSWQNFEQWNKYAAHITHCQKDLKLIVSTLLERRKTESLELTDLSAPVTPNAKSKILHSTSTSHHIINMVFLFYSRWETVIYIFPFFWRYDCYKWFFHAALCSWKNSCI